MNTGECFEHMHYLKGDKLIKAKSWTESVWSGDSIMHSDHRAKDQKGGVLQIGSMIISHQKLDLYTVKIKLWN